jgi:N-formylglutamate amidohydrolase
MYMFIVVRQFEGLLPEVMMVTKDKNAAIDRARHYAACTLEKASGTHTLVVVPFTKGQITIHTVGYTSGEF